MDENKTIHEARGLCWHQWPKFTEKELFTIRMSNAKGKEVCVHCGVDRFSYENRNSMDNPDYTDPIHYCELMDWIRDKASDLYMWTRTRHDTSMLYHWLWLSRQEQITLIAEAIEVGVLK